MTYRLFAACAIACALCGLPLRAEAFSILTGVTIPCHEGIMLTAYEQSGVALHDLDFALPTDTTWEKVSRFLFEGLTINKDNLRDRFFLFSMFVGVRSPDTAGHSTFNLLSLRQVHANPQGQYEHCLRAAADDGSEGDRAAQAGCIGFIGEQIQQARALLQLPAAEQNITVSFAHEFYGTFDVEVWGPIYYIARASHALQDSFTHTIRSADLRTIYSFMNFAEAIGGSLKEARDGMAHSEYADHCDDGMREVPSAAVDATSDLLRAAASSVRTDSNDHLNAVAAKWLSMRPDCGYENNYCDSPWLARARREPTEPLLGCAVVDRSIDPLEVLTVGLLLLGLRRRKGRSMIARWRRLRERCQRSRRSCSTAAVVLALLVATSASGCGADLDRSPITLAVLYPISGKGDLGFADSVSHAMTFGRWQFQLTLDESEPTNEEEASVALTRALAAEPGPQLLIAVGAEYQQPLVDHGCSFADTHVLYLDGSLPACPQLRSVSYWTFAPAFLAGVVAIEKIRLLNDARAAEGIAALPLRAATFGAVDIEPVRELLQGFVAGVAYAGGEIAPPDYLADDSSGFTDVEGARKRARDLFADAVVVFPAAGRASLGAVDAAQSLSASTGQPHFVIGVDADLSPLAPTVVLASVIKRLDRTVRETMFTVAERRFEAGDVIADAAQGDTELLINLLHDQPIESTDGQRSLVLSSAVQEAAEAATAAEAEYHHNI